MTTQALPTRRALIATLGAAAWLAGCAQAPPAPESATKKKRGFWARLFGVGDEDDKNLRDKEKPPSPPKRPPSQ